MTKPPVCTYDAVRGWCTPEHLRDCADSACRGCRPCAENHCDLNGRCGNHVEHDAGIYTCPSCIRRVRKDLTAIVDLYALVPVEVDARGMELGPLLAEAADAGVESEAFNLVGPAADPEVWAMRRARLVALNERRGWCDWPRHEGLAEDDPHHPYAVLARWDMAMRESYGPYTDLFITVTSASDYLAGLLDGPFAHVRELEDFAREIRACREHLEQVLHDSRDPEKGAPCPTCYDEAPDQKAARLRKRYGADLLGKQDTWHCPVNPAHWWTDDDYRWRVKDDYLEYAPALTASQMHEVLGVPAGSVRAWASLGKVRKRGRDHNGLILYDVDQVIALRDARDAAVLAQSDAGP